DIALAQKWVNEIQQALSENRGLTPPIGWVSPLGCNGSGGLSYPPATNAQGTNIAYTKPILLLTDNYTLSASEFFAATLQDIKRAAVYGVRTDGGGGNVVSYDFNAAPYSEGSARMTQSIIVRHQNVTVPGLPTAPYIENIGIKPDIYANYQTRTNLLTGGQPFVFGFSSVMSKRMKASQ
ncbi:MAG TPA: S41 family peptidase, partial [Terriglobales bacterium]